MKKAEKVITITDIISRNSRSKGAAGEINPNIEKLLSECSDTPHILASKIQEKSKSENVVKEEKHRDLTKVKYDKNNDPRIENTLFVGNVALHISERELLRKLEIRQNEVESMRFRSLPIHPKFASKKKIGAALECFSGNSSTKNAYIVLKERERMKLIIDKFSGAILAGNVLRLTPASKGNQFSTFDRKRTVFIGGLPKFCTEDELRKFVTISLNEDCVNSVRIIKSATTGKPKGFGFVLFNDRKFVVSSVKILNGAQFKDSKISVTRALSEEEAKNKANLDNSRRRIISNGAKNKDKEEEGFIGEKITISKKKAKNKANKLKKKLKKVLKKAPKSKKDKSKA
ncbi:Nop12p nucleolar [Cryptosporidium sp. chipmunk genotype I]|uniref:Nop12p nucleolar n=1 Tax=Cryptosporidium sp. chipmunk genotype I TaxID=1280935 RepID=UPI00351A3FF0|nr:Nop12p nucleolar [Cryptosporidium sp. chipmunk genotype I]